MLKRKPEANAPPVLFESLRFFVPNKKFVPPIPDAANPPEEDAFNFKAITAFATKFKKGTLPPEEEFNLVGILLDTSHYIAAAVNLFTADDPRQ